MTVYPLLKYRSAAFMTSAPLVVFINRRHSKEPDPSGEYRRVKKYISPAWKSRPRLRWSRFGSHISDQGVNRAPRLYGATAHDDDVAIWRLPKCTRRSALNPYA